MNMAYRETTRKTSCRMCTEVLAILSEETNRNGYINRVVFDYIRAYELNKLPAEFLPMNYDAGKKKGFPYLLLLRESLYLKPAQYGFKLSDMINQAILWKQTTNPNKKP